MKIYDQRSPSYTKTVLGVTKQEAIKFDGGDVIEKIIFVASDITSTAKTVTVKATSGGAVLLTVTIPTKDVPVKSSLTFLAGKDSSTLFFTPSFGSVDIIITYRNPEFLFNKFGFDDDVVQPSEVVGLPKRYTGLVSQTGILAPTVSVLNSDIGVGVWARTAVGTYTLTKVGAFPLGKTIPNQAEQYTDIVGNLFTVTHTSADVMTLTSYAVANTTVLADGVLSDRYINIEIYS